MALEKKTIFSCSIVLSSLITVVYVMTKCGENIQIKCSKCTHKKSICTRVKVKNSGKYFWYKSIYGSRFIWPVWLNGGVFV